MCMAILLLIVGFVGGENLIFSDCGVRTSRRQLRGNASKISTSSNFNSSSLTPFARNPKIMHGTPTVEGQYPWQVSLELLHPSYGFIGHWCGGVLIDRNWVLSAAHCIHNDLFNLPLPALWTVVLGEYDRRSESGFEQRIPVDKIILHEKYHNFKHDLVLLKLGKPANTSPNARVRKICLPFADFKVNSMAFDTRPTQQSKGDPNSKPAYFFDKEHSHALETQSSPPDDNFDEDSDDFPGSVPFRDDNFLRHFQKSLLDASTNGRTVRSRTAKYMINHLVAERLRTHRSNRTHSTLSSEQTALKASVDASSGRLSQSSRSSRRLFTMNMFKPSNTHPPPDMKGKRWFNHPFAESIVLTNNEPLNRQQHRANLNSKFGNNRRRNDKFSHAPVYYRKEPNYRTEDAINPVPPEVNVPYENFASDVQTDHGSSTSAMPDTSQYVDCLATGWGKSTIDDELTDVLLQTRAPIQSSKKCEEAYGDFIKLHRGHLCAGNLDGAGGTCVGDSGGPLQCRISKRGPWILVGITSFGSGCAFKNYPDVYTKISFYHQWIVETIQNN
uniref:Peptidase S1 domain-containing protein n=1 Tax=Anopheles christyi TaxID=43041 RepID=A0A182JV34_9DIPT